jgi:hypothetical protein
MQLLRRNIKAVGISFHSLLRRMDPIPAEDLLVLPDLLSAQPTRSTPSLGNLFASLTAIHSRLISVLGSSSQNEAVVPRRTKRKNHAG